MRWVNLVTSVIDRGVGISLQNQANLFQNFTQVRPGALQAGQGSGLGLALCKQIVELHGGSIEVQSDEGHGSTFVFQVPFAVVADEAVAEVSQAAASTASIVVKDEESAVFMTRAQEQRTPLLAAIHIAALSTSINGDSGAENKYPLAAVSSGGLPLASLEVLVVDDAASNRTIMSALLKRKGVRSVAVENGLQAFDLIAADMDRFRLVLMDNLMPVMDGDEATRCLRAAGYRHLIAGVTGNVLDDDVREFLAAGADLVLAKPVKVVTLTALLEHVCRQGSLSRAAEGLMLARSGDTKRWIPVSSTPSLA